MKRKIKAFIEIGKELDYDIWLDPNGDPPFGLLGQGKTISEAKQDFFDCFEDMRNLYKMEGKEFPEIEFEFVYDTQSFLKYAQFSPNSASANKKQLTYTT